ncbi:Putative esterase [Dyella jiangningensis]|uniref:alpha/beta hydrolase n=1 Tax=Dyella sp. AtDHG13 TaxID=1938897 RepID=UPI000883D7B1|nr:alpha/beta hydrolase-fold protein [Dyella sp. AtDHG13]PXV61577.1 putative esterase [Dyella sp. AtDHG13]SDJ70861.1 Putative esterase [Dyella jiangningensis]
MRVQRKAVAACLWFGMQGFASALQAEDAAPPPVKLVLDAPAFAPEQVHVTVYLPPGYATNDARYPVLYANDGQDMEAVGLQDTLASLYAQHVIEPVIVVAVDMLKDRASGYGLFDRARRRSVVGGSRIGPIGARAYDYSAWLVNDLVPMIDTHYRTQASASGRAMLGWSLGALNAFCLGWEYPEVFGRVGAFSPSFWLAADRSDAQAVESTRLVPSMLARAHERKPVRFWFAVGGREETNDRNHNGVIDAVEDLQDVINGFTAPDGTHRRGLRDLGYSIDMDYAAHPSRTDDVAYDLFADGEHNQATWKRMLPVFLVWAYGAGDVTPAP